MNTLKKSVSVLLALLCVISLMSFALTASAADVQKVRVIVKNTTFSKADGAAWDGVMLDDYVTLTQGSSMQSVVEDALNNNDCAYTMNDWGYLSTINGLSEYAANGSGGWMMTLNDWFTSEASTAYTVENNGIKDGDEIVVMYSLYWGADLGSAWGNTDTHLSKLSVSNGTLDSEFVPSKTSYMLTIDNDEGVKITPEAINKNYQVRVYKNEYQPETNGAELNKNAEIDVKNGDTLYIGIGSDHWPTMETTSNETVYEIKIHKTALNKVESKLENTAENLLSKSTSVGSIGGEWAVIGLARAGHITPEYADNYYNNVITYVKENGSAQLHRTKSTENSRVILALNSIGKDVTDVSGYNLLEPLGDFDYVKKQGLNGAMWALIALDSNGYEIPEVDCENPATRQKLIDYLIEKQTTKGGWGFNTTTPYIDYTGMAVTALAPYYNTNDDVKTAVDTALDLMSESLESVNSPESFSQILTALCALGINPETDARFVKDGKTIIDRIFDYECENGFKHFIDGEYNQMATEQCFYSLADFVRLTENKTSLYSMADAFYDVNGDYKIDINDALLIQKYVALMAEFTEAKVKNSDINLDGFVTIGDVTSLQRYLVGLGI